MRISVDYKWTLYNVDEVNNSTIELLFCRYKYSNTCVCIFSIVVPGICGRLCCLKDSTRYDELLRGCHKRAAELLLQGCLKNGGLYIKLGQGLVSMNHILPKEYLSTLEVLQDQALHRRGNEVKFARTNA